MVSILSTQNVDVLKSTIVILYITLPDAMTVWLSPTKVKVCSSSEPMPKTKFPDILPDKKGSFASFKVNVSPSTPEKQ